MKRRLVQVLTLCSALVSATAGAETLVDYVNTCKSDLGITTPLPPLNCNNGLLFAPSQGSRDPTNDFVGYSRINDVVDLTFACRWAFGSTAASVEMLIHNRQTGHTCFFAASNPTQSQNAVSTVIVPPDDPNASNYWMQPADLDNANVSASFDIGARLRCVGCHVAGPYISSPRIAPFLAHFGLLNNGHDTVVNENASLHYHAVGSSSYSNPSADSANTSAFKFWDQTFFTNMPDVNGDGKPDPACSGACHSIGSLSTISNLTMNPGSTLIPSLASDIAAVKNLDHTANPLVIQTIMPPPTYSDYRWVNMDTPGDGSDVETLQRLQQQPQYQALGCTSPSLLQAHVVGSDVIFDTSGYQDKLHAFNLRDGLTCLSSEQTGSHACLDYQTRYECPTGLWTPWINSVSTAPNDHEERSSKSVATTIFAVCGSNVNPVAIQAKFTIPTTTNVVVIDGPPDRLAQFNNTGLVCNNADQGAGQACANYVVRFICPLTPGTTTLTTEHLDNNADQHTFLTAATTNVNQGINNQYLTVGRSTQQWIMEPVTDFSNSLLWTISVADRARAVRLRNVGTGFYATSNDVNKGPNPSAPYFFLLDQALQTSWTTQIWIKEPIPVPFAGLVRLRTAWVPPPTKSTTTQLYMTLTTAKNNDTGTQDVFIKPFSNADDGSGNPLDLQAWSLMGVNGAF